MIMRQSSVAFACALAAKLARWGAIGLALAIVASASVHASAQVAGSTQPAATANPIPLSGRQQSGGVSAGQTSQPSGSVGVVSPSLQIQGAYTGSVRSPIETGSISLSLADAVQLGLRFNLAQTGASNTVRQARAQRAQALAALLPSISANLSETGEKLNLAAEGLSASTLNLPASTALVFPTTVGPFHYYQATANISATLFNLTSLRNLRAADAGRDSSLLSAEDTRQSVVLAVCGSYMEVLSSEALVEYQQDQVRYAEASYRQAATQYEAGTKAQIDATRSLVQLHSEQERLLSEQANVTKQKAQLARLIGISLRANMTLTSKMNDDTTVPITLQDALRQSSVSRPDIKVAEAQLRVAEQTLQAARAERIPSAALQGNYGVQGVNPNQGTTVFSATASINVPIFTGGRIRADAEQADAAVEQRRSELQDTRGEVELEVRNAYIDLQVASGQVKLAAENRTLALDTLRQSQDRFAAGVATSVEVVQSQQTLSQSNSDYVNALYAANLARINLARAMGQAEQSVPTLLSEK